MTAVEVEIEVGETALYLLEEMLEDEITEELLEEYLEELLRQQILHHHDHIEQGDLEQ